jgi:hypothetical protein
LADEALLVASVMNNALFGIDAIKLLKFGDL